ncbi:MAG TPA: phospholipase D family protein [Candidatus Synoicihabitans sp.]|nr:phospholipase D family protein [Candidatus Synoicihabitans sp.]
MPPTRTFFVLLALVAGSPMRLGAAGLAGSPLGAAAQEVASAGAPDPTIGNHVALVSGGEDALLLRIHLIRQATLTIAVQTFIWTNDECGRLLMYELIEAARRGVKVRIIADHFASDQDPAIVAFLATAHPNLEIKHHRPARSRLQGSLFRNAFAALQSFRSFNQRMHNKVMVFDDTALITGGRNIENTYFDHSTELNFRDRDVLVIGPAVQAAAASFEAFWNFRYSVPSRELKDVAALLARDAYPRFTTRADYAFGSYFQDLVDDAPRLQRTAQVFRERLRAVDKARFVADEPGKLRDLLTKTSDVTRELRDTIEQARTSIVIQTPYLVLSPPARRVLRRLREEQPALAIRISTNSFASTDNIMAYSGNYRLRSVYVEDLALQVYEFKPQPQNLGALFPRYEEMRERAVSRIAARTQTRLPYLCIHSKSLVVDNRFAFVGSYNLDPRSENLNTEAGLFVEDAAFARELRAEIEADMDPGNSWVIARRPLPLRLDVVNGWVADVLTLAPLDLWPIQNTSSFELREDGVVVPPGHPDFHRHYREVGAFPGADGWLTHKEIVTRLYKAVGKPLTPLL